MNDRYLYRAKRKNWRELPKDEWWVGGYLYGIWDRRYILWGMTNDVPNMVEVDPSTICQCTGLRDKNGKLIYEKNIVRDEDGSVGIVEFGVWNYCSIGFYIRWLSGNVKYYRKELGHWAPKVEVIGSAIDNLELLEVGGGRMVIDKMIEIETEMSQPCDEPCKDVYDCESCRSHHKHLVECLEELKKYQAIGTVEEFRRCSGKKLKSLRKHIEETIGEVPMKNLSTEALLSIVYSKNMTGIGPSMLSVLADYVEYIEEFLSTPAQ